MSSRHLMLSFSIWLVWLFLINNHKTVLTSAQKQSNNLDNKKKTKKHKENEPSSVKNSNHRIYFSHHSRKQKRKNNGNSHPAYFSRGNFEKVIILSDQDWKDKIRRQPIPERLTTQQNEKNDASGDDIISENGAHYYWNNCDDEIDENDVNKMKNEYSEMKLDMIEIPSLFENYSDSKLEKELTYFKANNGHWSEQGILEIFLHAMGLKPSSSTSSSTSKGASVPQNDHHWFEDDVHVCNWTGITCGALTNDSYFNFNQQINKDVPPTSITKIHLSNMNLKGILPSELLYLPHLQYLNLNGNKIIGSIPSNFSNIRHLQYLDLGKNQLTGTIPSSFFTKLIHLDELWLYSNQLVGTIPEELFQVGKCMDNKYPIHNFKKRLTTLDLSGNMIVGTIPSNIHKLCEVCHMKKLFLEGNMLTGTIPTSIGSCKSLSRFDLNSNEIQGTLPTQLGQLLHLDMLLLSNNQIEGNIPTQLLRLSALQTLSLSNNQLSGSLPHYSWRGMVQLKNLLLHNNKLSGTMPSALGGLRRMNYLDLHVNSLTGQVPKELGKLRDIVVLDLSFNDLSGSLPDELGQADMLLKLNITSNRLSGTIPDSLCKNILINDGNALRYGCHAIACPAGSFSGNGAASSSGTCRSCQNKNSKILGKISCASESSDSSSNLNDKKYLNQLRSPPTDLRHVDGNGIISQREVLRMLYLYTSIDEIGSGWNNDPTSIWHKWKDLKVHECDLPGIICRNGDVVSILLQDVDLCNQGNVKGRVNEAHNGKCWGLPSELGLLNYLEVLDLSHSPGLRGNIPSELGDLQYLKDLNLSFSPNIGGTLPAELGNLKSLAKLNLADIGLQGSVPTEIGGLKNLKNLDLSSNFLTGSVPDSFGNLSNVKEIFLSRNELNGTIPESFGNLLQLQNLDLSRNKIEGTLPKSLSKCLFLMKIDVFNNKISGTIPEELCHIPMLQILHLKNNYLTGTIPGGFGGHPLLSWFDASFNLLRGKIPETFGSKNRVPLKNLRLGENRLQGVIPASLCSHEILNGGGTKIYGCDAILCPVGRYRAEMGFASLDSPCLECPQGETTLFLGGTQCNKYTQRDYLKIFYEMMQGDKWDDKYNKDWNEENVSECNWAGVSCDDDGLIDGLSFPISASLPF